MIDILIQIVGQILKINGKSGTSVIVHTVYMYVYNPNFVHELIYIPTYFII